MIAGVLFDLDGVLVSTDEFHFLGWKYIADREGIYFDRKINHRQRGISRMQSLEVLLEKAPRLYDPIEKEALAKAKNREYRRLLGQLSSADILPGVTDVLTALREAGIRLAVASSSRNAPKILERTGLACWFDAVVDGNEIARSKPDPQVFLLAADRLDLPADRCLVVEDSLAGVAAGRVAGMAVLGVGDESTLPSVTPRVGSLAQITAEQMLELDEQGMLVR